MDFKNLNELLKSFYSLRNSGNRIEKIEDEDSENTWSEIYKVPGEDDMFVKLDIEEDSYGDNEKVVGIQFVKPAQKTVTAYQSL